MSWSLFILAFMAGLFSALAVSQNKAIVKMIHDTLRNPRTGEWSRKNLTGFASFVYSISYCQGCLFKGVPIQTEVLLIFNATALTCLGISSWEKANVKPQNPQP